MHTKNSMKKRFDRDLVELGLRHRRLHDTRRTFVTLARQDGAARDLLETITHRGRGNRNILDAYTSFSWEAKCVEVAKLRFGPPTRTPPKEQADDDSADESHAETDGGTRGLVPSLVPPEPNNLILQKKKNGGGAGNRTRVRKGFQPRRSMLSR